MSTSLDAKRLEAAGHVNRRHAFLTRAAATAHLRLSRLGAGDGTGNPAGGIAAALDAIEAIVEAWPRDLGARDRWLAWLSRVRALETARRRAFRAAAAAEAGGRTRYADLGPDAVRSGFLSVARGISTCVVELYALDGPLR